MILVSKIPHRQEGSCSHVFPPDYIGNNSEFFLAPLQKKNIHEIQISP